MGVGPVGVITDWFPSLTDLKALWQNATQGTLSEGQKNEIRAQVDADLERAAGGDGALADRAKEQAAKELTVVFDQAQAEAEAANLWNPLNSTGLTRWMLIAGAVLLGWTILNAMVLRWAGSR